MLTTIFFAKPNSAQEELFLRLNVRWAFNSLLFIYILEHPLSHLIFVLVIAINSGLQLSGLGFDRSLPSVKTARWAFRASSGTEFDFAKKLVVNNIYQIKTQHKEKHGRLMAHLTDGRVRSKPKPEGCDPKLMAMTNTKIKWLKGCSSI